MALRIGKKNQADDWSEDSLQQELAQISAQDETLPSQALTSATNDNDPFAGFADAAPETFVAPEPDATQSLGAPSARGPKVSPILLAGGLVFIIVAVAVGVWLTFFNAPAEDASTSLESPITQRPPRSPLPPAATKVIPTKPQAPGAKPVKPQPPAKTAAGAPRTPITNVRPGKAGIVPKGAKAPVVLPKKPTQAPRVAPVIGVPTPVVPPPGMAGIPGKGSTATTSVEIVGSPKARSSSASPQLKTLWKQGANAKHRGDYAGARRAWTKILQLRPGHPGIQDAIDKLPN